MANIAPEVDLLARTFGQLRLRGLELVRQRVGEFRFQSFIQTDVVPAMIDVVAWFHEQNAHYYDRKQRNSLLILADTRESMRILTQAQGYRMRPKTSASVSVRVTSAPPKNVPITIPAGTRVQVGDLVFEAIEAIIPAGAKSWPDGTTDDLVVFVEGSTKTDSFVSDGAVFQEFTLSSPGIIDGSVSGTVGGTVWEETASLAFSEGSAQGRDNFIGDGSDFQEVTLSLLNAIVTLGDEDGLTILVTPVGQPSINADVWKQVSVFSGAPREYIALQTATGVTTIRFGDSSDGAAPDLNGVVDVLYVVSGAQRRYQLRYDQDDQGIIMFGDGFMGSIPPSGAALEFTYKVGGGVRGNIAIDAIDTTIAGVLPSGAKTSVRVTNLERGSGGEPEETVEEARFLAPRVTKANLRAVTKEDWTALASAFSDPTFGSPSYASAFLKQRVPELNTVIVSVWGRDDSGQLSTPGTPLKAAIKKYLDTIRTICTRVEMADGRVVTLDIEADIELEVGQTQQAVFTAIRAAIERFFLSAFVRPGVDLSISRLYRTIQNVNGVARAEITSVVGSIISTLELGDGDDVTVEFSGDFLLLDGTAVVPGSVELGSGVQQLIDDGAGSFIGNVDVTGTNTIDYATGKFTATFENAPALGDRVFAEAKLEAFFPHVESLGGSDGTVQVLDAATQYYPIVKRRPRGVWSGDPVRVIDAFRTGVSNHFRGTLSLGIIPGSLVITDNGGQVLTDNGTGGFSGPGVGSVNYVTGLIDITFSGTVTLTVRAEWNTLTLDIFLPQDYFPIQAGRTFFWAGFGNFGAYSPTHIIAADDGDGHMFGDVVTDGVIFYDIGRVTTVWNAIPAPGFGGGPSFTATLYDFDDDPLAPLVPAVGSSLDGITRRFRFSVPGSLSLGVGRTRFQFSDLSTIGTTFQDGYDNWQGQINSPSLDPQEIQSVSYAGGTGIVTFASAPISTAGALGSQAAAGDFKIQVTNVAVLMYSSWVYRVKTPAAPGLDRGLFADNVGRLWGPFGIGSVNTHPTDRLDHRRGRYIAVLEGGPIPEGRQQELTYDSLTGVPPALDIPVSGDEVLSLGKISLTEQQPEQVGL